MIARRLVLFGLGTLTLFPAILWAQAATGSIAGVVRDTSGAVLPGVTVEASSPALIEKVRTVVTDENGAYRIVELRPGAYTVTFTLPGFATVRREGIELTTSFTAAVNADMRVGGVEETITVTGETPVVDLSSARQQTTVSREVLDAIPTTKRLGQYASFIPGATYSNPTFQDSGGTAGEGGQFGVHGQRAADEIVNMDGLNQNMFGLDVYSYNSQTIQEVVVETGGTSAEAMTGGVQLNIIPRTVVTPGRGASAPPGPVHHYRATISTTTCAREACRPPRPLRDSGTTAAHSAVRSRATGSGSTPPTGTGVLRSTSRAPTSTRVRTSCSMCRTSIGWPSPTGITTTTTFV
jgi:Carboxypeptidase regulatory-like domain